MVAFAAFVGSISSIFLRFSGGRGVSTALGVWLGLAPVVIPIAFVVFGAVLAISRIMSLASIAAAIALPAIVAALSYPKQYVVLAIVISALVVWRHRANIGRLLRGKEPTLKGAAKKAT
jgi:glycerol-3-phosphate acyltransferase PlsY